MTIDAPALEAWMTAVFRRTGVAEDAAAAVAEVLLHASLRGVDSHGLARLPGYVEAMRAGTINLDPHPRLLPGDGVLRAVDGDNAPGAVPGIFAADHAIELAKTHGAGIVVVRRSTHYGAASYYARRIAEQRLIGLSMTTAPPGVIPYGGMEPVLGTNPIAIAAPLGDGRLWDLDMATSQVALNRIFNAADEGREIPLGWGVDSEGRGTTDPNRVIAGVPLGGYKGYGLALMVQVLSGVLAGVGEDTGHIQLALDPDRTVGITAFERALADLLATLKQTPPAPGFDEVLVSGEPQARAQAERERDGIPVEPALYAKLETLAEELGVPLGA